MIGWILLAIPVALFFYLIGIYNTLVRLRNGVKNAWSQIDVQLKRRHDLIPNLVETAKGYMKHERETLEQITQARSRAMGAGSVGEKSQAEGELSGALSKFMLVVENYPDLKANTNFLSVQEELTSTENKIAFSRQGYNDSVYFFNNKIEVFPSNIIANTFNFAKEEFFGSESQFHHLAQSLWADRHDVGTDTSEPEKIAVAHRHNGFGPGHPRLSGGKRVRSPLRWHHWIGYCCRDLVVPNAHHAPFG
jgi:LemA protein